MKKNLLFITAVLLVCCSVFSQQIGNRKATFVNKDVFHSGVFLENNDIIPDYQGASIRYYVQSSNVHAYFTEGGVIYKISKLTKTKVKKEDKDREEEEGNKGLKVSNSLAIMQWEGANPHPVMEPGSAGDGYYTFLKKDGATYKTITTHGYKTIRYKDVYPGIDIEYTIPDKGGIEYNLIVQPGADVSVVSMHYTGDVKSIRTDNNGNIVIHTKNGDIMEHAPQSSYSDGGKVTSAFSIAGNRFRFNLAEGYNKLQQLIIDPWVTTLTTLATQNMGFNVDYDFTGNLFVFGAGPATDVDFSQYFKISKYDVNGNFLWTFMGSVPSENWTTADVPDDYNSPGNMIVDKSTGKTYAGKGVEDAGTQTIRLDQNGNYDNFISIANVNITETWGFAYNCKNESLLEMGGGINSTINMGFINTTSGAIVSSNISEVTGAGRTHQDIVCAAYDSAGNLYSIMNDRLGYLPYANTLYRANSTFNGYTWKANSGYASFNETENAPYWNNALYQGNWFNALAANGSYLYYFDGFNLAAYQLASGALAGNSYSITGYTPLFQGGIAVDNCNNIYLGGVGVIKTFYFDGTNFNPLASISLGAGFQNDTILDIKYNATNNLLYVTGKGIVGTITATLSTSCTRLSTYSVATSSPNCDSATVHVSPSAELNPQVFTYLWTDSANNIVSELSNTADTVNTVTGLPNGTYNVQVQWNTNCGGTSQTQSVVVKCYTFMHSNDTTVCIGQPAKLWAAANGGTFSWSPGGSTDSTITVSPDTTTVYTVTYTPPTGSPSTATIRVTVTQLPTVTIPDTSVCAGTSASISSKVSIPGGAYLWTPGGATTPSIEVSPSVNTSYKLTYTANGCHPVSALDTVSILPLPTDSIVTDKSGFCPNDSAQLCALTSFPSLKWNTNATSTCITAKQAGSYYVMVTDNQGCTGQSNQIAIKAYAAPASPISANKTNLCTNDSSHICAPPGFAIYQWNNGGAGSCIEVKQIGTYFVSVTDNNGCTAVSNQVSINSSAAPVDSISADKTIFCPSDSANVCSDRGFTAYRWNTGDTVLCIVVKQTGSYVVTVTDNNGCTAQSNQIPVTVNPGPDDVISADKTSLCPNDSSSICATSGYIAYQWNNDGSGACIVTTQAGNYAVTITDSNGCTAGSNVITISVHPAPSDTITSDKSIFCPSDSAQICNSGNFTSYQWNNGKTGKCIDVNEAGDYYVTITDTYGCTAQSNRLPINVYPVPSVSIIAEGDLLTSYGAVTYQWYFNGSPIPGATTDTLHVSQAGEYSLEVTDSYGCFTLSNPVNMVSTGIGQLAQEGLLLYPNPSTGTWQLEVDNDLVGSAFSVYDMQGQIVYQSEIRNVRSEITLNAASGVYWLQISSTHGNMVRKMVKL